MTISTLTSRVSYPGTGSTGPFAIPFRFFGQGATPNTAPDLLVTKRSLLGVETTLAVTTDYTVTGAGDATGTLTLLVALAVGETLFIRRKPPLTQPMSIRNQGVYFPATIEDEDDRLVMQLQAMQDSLDRCVKLKESVNPAALLTEMEPTNGYVLTGTGTGFQMSPISSGAVALPGNGRTVTTLSAFIANNAVFNVKDYGAIGDGVQDDTLAIQRALDNMPFFPLVAGTLVFPWTGAFYRITDSINIGVFSVAGNNNVQGFAQNHGDITIDLQSPIKWDGPDQPGTTKVTKNDTVGSYPLITDCKPMISVVACRHFSIRGKLDGLSPNGLKQAHSCIWFQGNHNVHTFTNFTTLGARIGVRHGCAWDLAGAVQYWGYADSPYYKANVYNAPAVGGWQGDAQHFSGCSLNGSLAAYTTESGQNLGIVFTSTAFNEAIAAPNYAIVMVGGRITGNGISIEHATIYDVWMITGTNSFTATELHSESATIVTFRTSTAAVAPNITLINSDSSEITLAGGGGKVTIIDSGSVSIIRLDVAARADITVIGSAITGFVVTNTGARDNLNITLENCTIAGAILAGATPANCYLYARNCYLGYAYLPAQSSSFSTTNESFNGQTHTVKNKIAVAHNVTTLLGTINTDLAGASSTGTCLLRVNFSTGAALNIASVFGLYAFAWTRDSGNTITLSAVSVINETKGLDGIAAFTVTITVVLNGTDIQIKALQTNTPATASVAELQGEVYEGGNYATIGVPLWTPA